MKKAPQANTSRLKGRTNRGTTLITAKGGHSVRLNQAFCQGNGASRNCLLQLQQFCSGTRGLFRIISAHTHRRLSEMIVRKKRFLHRILKYESLYHTFLLLSIVFFHFFIILLCFFNKKSRTPQKPAGFPIFLR